MVVEEGGKREEGEHGRRQTGGDIGSKTCADILTLSLILATVVTFIQVYLRDFYGGCGGFFQG